MYRLTISGPITEEFLKTKTVNTCWIRMYRWGNKCGEYVIENNEWNSEIRRFVAYSKDSENQAVLEKVEPIDAYSPPYDVDDIWEEEVVKQGNITCGNLLVITGDIQNTCAAICPAFSNWLVEHLGPIQIAKTPVQPKQSHFVPRKYPNQGFRKSVCLIQDY